MTKTTRLGLPLVQAAQAQKHVTVNEALSRLDGLVQLRLVSQSIATPPVADDGVAYAVPAGATDAWAGRAGQVAIAVGGGWDFVTPDVGWMAWLASEARAVRWEGTAWVAMPLAVSPSGAATQVAIEEFDHVMTPGASDTTASVIPANAMVLAASARVTDTISGTLSAWELGTGAATDRFGSGLGLAAGSFASGILSGPTTYYADTPLTLTALGGNFGGGTVRIALHYIRFALPQI
ncbi:DUF2793 domain-containing protein [Actibacterium sp. 188UL27-1]|uniref:DUF2793 domain-containing protein n=1 Tax=Actibacterium sp. 188UL27-1 TaxID=2786961 RepID=UPI00195DFA00|nr:DUF2793 domain-containing protein [Actibacterium sp. 188UL27-1]MBM7068027.1 DUF2793 domain-containing protein [Actibacterium sp. 188UL27-1]